jgi:hypothetical protein
MPNKIVKFISVFEITFATFYILRLTSNLIYSPLSISLSLSHFQVIKEWCKFE